MLINKCLINLVTVFLLTEALPDGDGVQSEGADEVVFVQQVHAQHRHGPAPAHAVQGEGVEVPVPHLLQHTLGKKNLTQSHTIANNK